MTTIKLMVCPHDTAKNPENWYKLALYLTKNVGSSVIFKQSIDFPDFHQQLMNGELIYANPQDSVQLIKEHGYLPIARPSNLSDEIVFVANKNFSNPKMTDLTGSTISSVSSMMVTKIGMIHLQKNDIRPAKINSKKSWMAVVKSIFRCEVDYAMIYKDFYDSLTEMSKSGLQKIGETKNGEIHHNVLISPELKDSAQAVQTCLLNMHKNNNYGQEVLTALNIKTFIGVNSDEILKFENLHISQKINDYGLKSINSSRSTSRWDS